MEGFGLGLHTVDDAHLTPPPLSMTHFSDFDTPLVDDAFALSTTSRPPCPRHALVQGTPPVRSALFSHQAVPWTRVGGTQLLGIYVKCIKCMPNMEGFGFGLHTGLRQTSASDGALSPKGCCWCPAPRCVCIQLGHCIKEYYLL